MDNLSIRVENVDSVNVISVSFHMKQEGFWTKYVTTNEIYECFIPITH